MSDDDANEGASPGECPGHDFSLTAVLVVDGRLRQVQTCRWCGAPAI